MRIGMRRGLKAWVVAQPWADAYEVRIVHDAGGKVYVAARIEDGHFVYEEREDGAEVAPVLRLGAGEIDALLEALKQSARPTDETVDAVRDARATRDRLLALIEKRGL